MRKWIVLSLAAILAVGLAVIFSRVAQRPTASPDATPRRSVSVKATPPSATPSKTGRRTAIFTCITSSQRGECGPYTYPQIEGLGSGNQHKLTIGNNIWSPVNGAASTLHANNPGNWMVAANMPIGNTGVVSYPSLDADYHLEKPDGNWYEPPLTKFGEMVSSFSEKMNEDRGSSAWAAYDIWLNGGKDEVMIQHDFAGNGPCDYTAVHWFGGSEGVPARLWGLCVFGSERVWKLATPGSVVGSSSTTNERSGSVDILGMLTWMTANKYLPATSTLGLVGYGWEIASTGGVTENFQVSSFSITTKEPR